MKSKRQKTKMMITIIITFLYVPINFKLMPILHIIIVFLKIWDSISMYFIEKVLSQFFITIQTSNITVYVKEVDHLD